MTRFLSLVQRAVVLFPPALILALLALLVAAVLTARLGRGAASENVGALRAGEAGSFSALQSRGVIGDQLTPHHIPQAAAGYTTYSEGGALALEQAEHVLTRTYGFRGAQTLKADAGLTFRQVLARDVWDIRSIAGTRYNSGLRDLIDYYRVNFPSLLVKGAGS